MAVIIPKLQVPFRIREVTYALPENVKNLLGPSLVWDLDKNPIEDLSSYGRNGTAGASILLAQPGGPGPPGLVSEAVFPVGGVSTIPANNPVNWEPYVPAGGAFTVELWVKPAAGEQPIIARSGSGTSAGPSLYILNSAGTIRFRVKHSIGDTGANRKNWTNAMPTDGNWHHMRFSFDDVGNVANLHIDNVDMGSGTGLTQAIDTTAGAAFAFGRAPSGTTIYVGSMAAPAIYPRVLTADEGTLVWGAVLNPEIISPAVAAVVEQDSTLEVRQCVDALLRTPIGKRLEEPEYGVPELAFRQTSPSGIERTHIRTAISRWEPRAEYALTEDDIGEIEQTISIDLNTGEEQ